MCEGETFGNQADRPDFCGPRINPILRIKRIIAEQIRRDECARRDGILEWVREWQNACAAAGGHPRPDDAAVRAKAVRDMYIDQMRATGQCTGRREDEKWLS